MEVQEQGGATGAWWRCKRKVEVHGGGGSAGVELRLAATLPSFSLNMATSSALSAWFRQIFSTCSRRISSRTWW